MIRELTIHNLKENKVHILSIFAIILMYGTISVAMYDPNPNGLEAFQEMLDQMPAAMISLLGFESLTGPMISYISNYLYGFIMIIFPMIYIILVSNRLVSKHIDKGSMIYILTMPYTRKRIITNQLLFYIISFLFIYISNVVIVIGVSEIMFKGLLDIKLFIILNYIVLSVHLFTMSLAFLSSTFFSDSQKNSGITSAVLILAFVFTMLSRLGDKIEFIKYLTPYSIINVDFILEGNGNGIIGGTIMLVISIIIFITSIHYFDKKSIII